MARARATMMLGGNLGRQIQRHGVSAAYDTPNSSLRARTRWIAATHSTFDGFFDAKHPQQEAQMVRVELDTVIARPIDDVFGRLTDLSEYSRWMPKTRSVHQKQPDFGRSGRRRDHLLRQGMDGHLCWRNRGVSRSHQSRVQGEAQVAGSDRHGSETGVRAGFHADRY